MTEYTVKEIGHQWTVYADRQTIASCADQASALKLIAEDSAADSATRKSRVVEQAITRRPEPAPSIGHMGPRSIHCPRHHINAA